MDELGPILLCSIQVVHIFRTRICIRQNIVRQDRKGKGADIRWRVPIFRHFAKAQAFVNAIYRLFQALIELLDLLYFNITINLYEFTFHKFALSWHFVFWLVKISLLTFGTCATHVFDSVIHLVNLCLLDLSLPIRIDNCLLVCQRFELIHFHHAPSKPFAWVFCRRHLSMNALCHQGWPANP